jgi:hypothetical protein
LFGSRKSAQTAFWKITPLISVSRQFDGLRRRANSSQNGRRLDRVQSPSCSRCAPLVSHRADPDLPAFRSLRLRSGRPSLPLAWCHPPAGASNVALHAAGHSLKRLGFLVRASAANLDDPQQRAIRSKRRIGKRSPVIFSSRVLFSLLAELDSTSFPVLHFLPLYLSGTASTL